MKVIFCDFDGVLNSRRYMRGFNDPATGYLQEPHPNERFDEECVARLNKIVEATGAYVVVTSTARVHKRRVQLQEMLVKKGFKGVVYDKTPDNPPRRGEIVEWIVDYRRYERLGTLDAYVILDDERVGGHDAHEVNTNPEVGLSDADVERAIAILNGGSK